VALARTSDGQFPLSCSWQENQTLAADPMYTYNETDASLNLTVHDDRD